MAPSDQGAWRCSNCGYVHRGPVPPESCPICGAPANEFVPYDEPVVSPAASPGASPGSSPGHGPGASAGQWRCLNCGFVADTVEAPAECPLCGAPGRQFELISRVEVSPSPAGQRPFRAVVIGAGVAGVSAAEAIRAAAPAAEITLVSAERGVPYYRLNLTRYLAGEITVDALPLHALEWYLGSRIELLSEVRAEAIQVAERTVRMGELGDLPFDRLVLATGAHPFIPQVPGADHAGVTTLRTREDADRILEGAGRGDPVVVIGGGVLGLETAGALARRGVEVTVLEGHEWLMPRQLNREAGARLERHVATLGIRLEKRASVKQVTGSAPSLRVELSDGRALPACVVVLAAGVRPNTHLARRAGLDVNQGILVNHHMMSSAPGVFAAGDAAEHNGVLYGTWAASQYQGTIAGMNAAELSVVYGGQPRSNTLKVLGLDLLSIGTFDPVDGSYLVVEEKSEDRYVRFVLHDGRLVGAILLGDLSQGAAVKAAIEQRLDYSGLLLGSASAAGIAAHAQAAGALGR